ncbi:cysteine desulfurase family protein [Lachnoclostridium phytofermentans]|uniref:Aminotransferase class V n=1 Tax=Lachnoclostridium phytofermentans (strain ATCC 700394 / DSM 18823 / ISDg) TaxID=357809 RepID=A9KRA0_LACP7|nr:cysteine desulfurase family protein [Lachnoclostridium phytofermentans]ABX40568.1 aminotransferase class V [Lachnoclostridium phytofermentans ISDg]
MIYLDYAANTPASEEVLKVYLETEQQFIANPNSSHPLGILAKERLTEVTKELATLLKVEPEQIIPTSGASEANNLAIKGITYGYRENGRHIISTCLEHPSVSGSLTFLQSLGYEIDLVDILPNGQVDLEHLKELLRKDTVLVSICTVDSELGTVQPIKEIAKILESYENCFFHTDATQGFGKIEVDLSLADLTTFTPHKFYGLNGTGVLVKKKDVVLLPQIHGGSSTTIYRSGTPMLSNVVALTEAVNLSLEHYEDRLNRVVSLRKQFESKLSKYPNVRINSTECGVPHILNISVKGVRAITMKEHLEEYGICISIKSACSATMTPSRPVYAVTKDKKNALSSFRISLSHLTTEEEVEKFFEGFDASYQKAMKN